MFSSIQIHFNTIGFVEYNTGMDNMITTVGYWLTLALAWLAVIAWNIYIWRVPVEKQRQISREMIHSNRYWFPEEKSRDLWMVDSSCFLWQSRIFSILLTVVAVAFTVFVVCR